MHVETRGDGPDLVLVHGWAMHSGVFAPLVRALETEFRLHLVDLPGHGRSSGAATLDLSDAAARIAAATPRAVWIGWSLGGLVALRAALDRGDRVRGLIMIAASPRFVAGPDWPSGVDASVFHEFGRGLGGDYRRTIERFLALETIGSDRARAELRELKSHVFEHGEPVASALRDGLAILEDTDLRGALDALRVPNLWIAGRRDRLVAARGMREAAARAGGQYLEFDSGHAPFLAHTDAVADAIAAFVDGLA